MIEGISGIPVVDRRHSHVLQQPLACPRAGLMLHYDDSSRDDWAVEWFHDPRCTNGYTWLVLDDGRVVELADPAFRTPHAGPCRTPNANSAFYGVAAATNGLVPVTDAQLAAITAICAAVLTHHAWTDDALDHRLVGHDEQAIWTPAYTSQRALWGTLGRKVDPRGQRKDGKPILDLVALRQAVRAAGGAQTHETRHTTTLII
jgi:N-acetyl-anhydromuramyl-L-alanine amidase AmpD